MERAKNFETVISVTWNEVLGKLCEIDVSQQSVASEIIKQFKEYIAMSGEALNLMQLNSQYDEDIAKGQFDLLLERLSEQLKSERIFQEKKPSSGWARFGVQDSESQEILINPHFSVYLTSEGVGCALTVSNFDSKTMKEILSHNSVKQMVAQVSGLNRPEKWKSQRYRLSMKNYRILDKKKGQQSGDTYNSFVFEINLGETMLVNPRFKIEEMVEVMKQCSKAAKQLDIELHFQWAGKLKSTPLADGNSDVFRNSYKLIEEFVMFMRSFSKVCRDIHGVNL